MKLTKLFFAAVIVLSANASFAQLAPVLASHNVNINIPEVALLDLKSLTGTSITLTGTEPTVAGDPMDFSGATNSTIYMNYSSIVRGALVRNVTVQITSGSVPTGLKLTVKASAATGGAGNLGDEVVGADVDGTFIIPASDGTAAPIVTGIGSAYTGKANGNGRNLTYTLGYATDAATDYASLRNVDLIGVPLTITYTLSEI